MNEYNELLKVLNENKTNEKLIKWLLIFVTTFLGE